MRRCAQRRSRATESKDNVAGFAIATHANKNGRPGECPANIDHAVRERRLDEFHGALYFG